MINDYVLRKINDKYDSLFFVDQNKKCFAHVCLICDTFVHPNELRKISIEEILKCEHILMNKEYTQFSPTMSTNYRVSQCKKKTDNNKLKHLFLSPRSSYVQNRKDARFKSGFSICNTCYTSLQKKKMPIYGIINNFCFGSPPKCLTELTEVEMAFITPIKTRGFCFTYTGGQQKQLKGSLSYFRIDKGEISQVADTLSNAGLSNNVIFLIYGQITPQQHKKALSKSFIRTKYVIDAIQWLKKNNLEWKKINTTIHEAIFAQKPIVIDHTKIVDSVSESIESQESYEVFFPDAEASKLQSNNNILCALQNTISNSVKSQHNINLKCNFTKFTVEDFNDNSIVNTCLLQFPYGIGGLYEYRLNAKGHISTYMDVQQYIRHLTRISQPHFHHNLFVLVLYNVYIKQKMYKTSLWRVRNNVDTKTIATDLTMDDIQSAINKKINKSKSDSFNTGSKLLDSIDAVSGNIPHTNEAARTARKCAEAMQHHLGCPSYFLTVTPDDDNSYFVQVYAETIVDDKQPLSSLSEETFYDRANMRTILRLKYPGICALQFEYFLDIIITNVLGWDMEQNTYNHHVPNTLFGPLDGFAIAVEEQGRKSLHAHMLIWVKDHNTIKANLHSKKRKERKNAEDYLCKQLDNIATCKFFNQYHCPSQELKRLVDHNCEKCRNYELSVINNQELRHLRYKSTDSDRHYIKCVTCNESYSIDNLMEKHLVKNVKIKNFKSFPDCHTRQLKSWAVAYQKPYNNFYPLHSAILDAAYNHHVHSASCFKNNNNDSTFSKKRKREIQCECRYKYPKPKMEKTEIENATEEPKRWYLWNGSFELRHIKEINIKRNVLDCFMNVSCPQITQSKMACNTNISMIMPGTAAQYTFKYATKSTQHDDEKQYKAVLEICERVLQKEPRDTLQKEARRRIMAGTYAHTSQNVTGAALAAWLLRKDSRFIFSHFMVWCPLRDIYQLLTGQKVSITVNIDPKTAYFKSSALDYLCRPKELDHLSPFHYYSKYKSIDKRFVRSQCEYMDFQNNTHFQHPSYRRKKKIFLQVVLIMSSRRFIKIHQYDFPDTANFVGNMLDENCTPNTCMEEYARISLLLLHHYRSYQDIQTNNSYCKKFRNLVKSRLIHSDDIQFLQNLLDAKSNSFRHFINGDKLERDTLPLTAITIDELMSDNAPNELVEDVNEEFDMYNQDHGLDIEFEKNYSVHACVPLDMSFYVLKHRGRLSCGTSMIATIDTGIGLQYNICTPIVQQPCLLNLNVETKNATYQTISQRQLAMIIITKSNYVVNSFPHLKQKPMARLLQANGTSKSILNWAGEACLDYEQKQAFQVIVSSFVLTFFYDSNGHQNKYSFFLKKEVRKLQKLVGHRIAKEKQLILFLHGPAGSGKSTVIDLVYKYASEFCSYMGHVTIEDNIIVLSAMTGVAATLIKGKTAHSALYLNQIKPFTQEQLEMWVGTKMIFIDEISFAGKADIVKINTNLQALKGALYKNYGGINIIFSGDMRQLEPIGKKPLYDEQVPQFTDLVNSFIEFKGIHRFSNDPEWGMLLNRFRNGETTEADIATINTRKVLHESDLPTNIRYATYFNADRDSINTALFCKRCENNKNDESLLPTTILIFSSDYKKTNNHKKTVPFNYFPFIWQFCGEDNIKPQQRQGRMDPVLKLFIGAPVIIPCNADVISGIANGTQATVVAIVLKQGTVIKHTLLENKTTIQSVLADEVDYITLQHTNPRAEPQLFNVYPKKHSFTVVLDEKDDYYHKFFDDKGFPTQYSAIQVPILSNFATTGHKLQGSTVASLFVHQWNYTQNWVYVVLSRIKKIEGLFIRQCLKHNKKAFAVPDNLRRMMANFHKKFPQQ